MRFYSFTNFYLNSISQGIQPGHCSDAMFVKYVDESPAKAVLFDWAKNHKTYICLNGGHYHGVLEASNQVEYYAERLQLPWANFHEDEQSLGGLMTCTGLVVPEPIYEAALLLRSDPNGLAFNTQQAIKSLSNTEIELARFLNQYGLAK